MFTDIKMLSSTLGTHIFLLHLLNLRQPLVIMGNATVIPQLPEVALSNDAT